MTSTPLPFLSAFTVSICGAMWIVTALQAGAVSVTNPSFEDGLAAHPDFGVGGPTFQGIARNTAPDGWTNSTTGSGAADPWATTPDWIDTTLTLFFAQPAGGWASDGSNVMGLDAYSFAMGLQDPFQGGIKQTISGLVPGREYTVMFEVMRSELRNGPPTFEVDLNPMISFLLDGDSLLTAVPSGTFLTELNQSNVAVYQSHSWQQLTESFTATSDTHEVGFLVNSSDPSNPLLLSTIYLDNVSIVPEPAPAVLSLVCGLALMVIRRR